MFMLPNCFFFFLLKSLENLLLSCETIWILSKNKLEDSTPINENNASGQMRHWVGHSEGVIRWYEWEKVKRDPICHSHRVPPAPSAAGVFFFATDFRPKCPKFLWLGFDQNFSRHIFFWSSLYTPCPSCYQPLVIFGQRLSSLE